MRLRAIDTTLAHQPVITGAVQDALTGVAPFAPATVELLYATPEGEPERSYPLAGRVSADGRFVYAGDPQTAFPALAAGQSLALRIRAGAAGYRTGAAEIAITAAMLQPVLRTLTVAGFEQQVAVYSAPLVERDIALEPLPIHLAGQVVAADDPATPVPGAQVQITAPDPRGPVTADARGFFTLRNLPVALSVTVRVTQAGFTTLDQVLTLHYREPVNQHVFALST